MKLAETNSTIYYLEQGILVSRLKPVHVLNLQDAVQNLEVRETLPLRAPIPVLMDIRALQDTSFEALVASVNPKDADRYSAAALLVGQKDVHEIIKREASRFKTSAVPTRVFELESEAMAWLSTFLEE